MSGTAAGNLRIQLAVDGMPEVDAALAKVQAAGTTALGGVSTAATQASGSMGRFNQIVQQGGFQLGDLVVQVQGGTSALTALSQQGSQFLGLFGPMGAVAGVALSIGTIAAGFLSAGNSADVAKAKGQAALDAMTKSAGQTATALREINDLFLSAGERAATLVNLQRTQLRTQAETRLGEVNAGSMELRRRLAEQEGFLKDIRAPAGSTLYRAEDDEARNVEARAIVTIAKLRTEVAAADREVDGLRESLAKLDRGGPIGSDKDNADAIRDRLDRRNAALREYAKTLEQINTNPVFDSTEKDRLTALAIKERDEALKRLTETAKGAATATRQALATVYEINEDGSQGESFERSSNVEAYLTRLRDRSAKERETVDKRATASRERAEKEQEGAAQRAQRNLDRTAERWGDAMAHQTYSALESAFDKSKSPAEAAAAVFGAALRTAAQAALSQLVFQPIIKSMLGSLTGTGVGNALGVGTTATSSGGVSYFDTASGLFKLSGGSGTSMVGGAVNSFDNWAATSGLFASSAGTYGSGAAALGGGMNSGAAMAGNAAASPSMFGTASGTIGGVAGIAGGAYGIYSGIQKGGVGGAVGVAGGVAGMIGGAGTLAAAGGAVGGALASAAPWLAAAGPYGLAIAAVLAIVSQLLPGQKPSDRTGVFRNNLSSGESSVDGLEGVRFSQETRDQAKASSDSIVALAASLRTALGVSATPFNYEIAVGARDGLVASYNGTSREYKADEAGSAAMIADITTAMIDSMKGLASAEVKSIIGASGGSNETLLGNLDWYNSTYKTIIGGLKAPLDAFQLSINALVAPIDEAAAKARGLGINETLLLEVRQKSIDAMVQQRQELLLGLNQSYADRRANASGEAQSLGYRLERFEAATKAEDGALYTRLRMELGLTDDQARPFQLDLDSAQNAERAQIERDAATARLGSGNSLLDRLSAADGSSETLEGRLASFERRATAEMITAAGDGITDIAQLERTLAAERLRIIKEFGEKSTALEAQQREQAQQNVAGVLGGITEFVRSMQLGDDSLLSPQAKLSLAERQFGDIAARAQTGDYDAISQFTRVGGNLLSAGRDYYGSGAGAASIESRILAVAESIGSLSADTLTGRAMESIMRASITPLADIMRELLIEARLTRMEKGAGMLVR